MIFEIGVLKPTEINKQNKISNFFTNICHLINLHQRKSITKFGGNYAE